ncbi:MAG: sugar isomerase [Chloroflexi bacterium]|nr:sugar isomerase [Chloroflexota bacterium]
MIPHDRIEDENTTRARTHARDLVHAREFIARTNTDPEAVIAEVARFSAAAPSWALGTGGTRFGRFPIGGEPRTTEEKVDDVAAINALTGANRSISLHVPWDDPADPEALRQYAVERGIAFDAMNSNTFQDNPSTTRDGAVSYKFGSLCHSDVAVRDAAVQHNLECIDLGVRLGSKTITVWLADGTSFPGQANFRAQFERVLDGLRRIYAHLPADWRMFTEHKPYEPQFYSSVVNDWGSSLLLAQGTGDRALCLVDLGHHLPNANIEQIVSRLAMAGRLGGFHFNDSKYGDDDLTTGSIKPYQLFLIFLELLDAGNGRMPPLAYMIDQSNNLKDPLEDLMQATDAMQVALAQALLVDQQALRGAQDANDPALAQEILHRAYRTDVRPLVAEARRRNNAALDPIATYRALNSRTEKIRQRGLNAVATGI